MVSDFFTYTMDRPAGSGFAMYGAGHAVWLAAAVLTTVLLCVWDRKLSGRRRRALELSVVWTAAALDLAKYVYLFILGETSADMLPLHLCGFAVYLSLFNALKPGSIKMEILYSLCMPGAAMALIFPAWTFAPLWNIVSIQNFLIHILLLAYPLMLIASGRFFPDWRRLPWCLLFLAAAGIPVYAFNKRFDTNFMFLNTPVPGTPLELFARWWGNPGYILGILLMILAVWAVLYLPFIVYSRLRKKARARKEEAAVS